MGRFDNTLKGYIAAKKYLIDRNVVIDGVDEYDIIKMANKRVTNYKYLCAVRDTTCQHSLFSDSDKCAAHGRLKCVHKIEVK